MLLNRFWCIFMSVSLSVEHAYNVEFSFPGQGLVPRRRTNGQFSVTLAWLECVRLVRHVLRLSGVQGDAKSFCYMGRKALSNVLWKNRKNGAR